MKKNSIENIKKIADRIRREREKSNLTQSDVAQKLGCTYQCISNYERGVSRIETSVLRGLCEIYKTDLNYIIYGSVDDSNLPETDTNDKKVLLSYHEQAHIKKYRACDKRGKDIVDTVLDYE